MERERQITDDLYSLANRISEIEEKSKDDK